MSALASPFLNVPLAMSADGAHQVITLLSASDPQALMQQPVEAVPRGYDIIDGIAIVPVQGPLIKESDWLSDLFGMTGYDTIMAQMMAAVADADVSAIVLQIDSPGGTCSGNFELSDAIRSMRGGKPIWAIVDDCACSAAYSIACAADRIVGGQTCTVGSIGVIAVYDDISKMLANEGIKINLITYGATKSDGWPYLPMTDAAEARLQARIDTWGDIFISMVARNRGMPKAAVQATEAAQYMGEAALEIGLIDAVMTPDAAFQELLASLS